MKLAIALISFFFFFFWESDNFNFVYMSKPVKSYCPLETKPTLIIILDISTKLNEENLLGIC